MKLPPPIFHNENFHKNKEKNINGLRVYSPFLFLLSSALSVFFFVVAYSRILLSKNIPPVRQYKLRLFSGPIIITSSKVVKLTLKSSE
jgi:hypothetical protein